MENIRIIKKEEINSEALKTGYRFKVITEGKKTRKLYI